jgi:ribosomal protein S18 acetylase RimI-like enzyme
LSLGVVDIRHFRGRDFEPLLDAEAKAWDATLHWDYTPSRRMISSCLDEKRLSGYALVHAGRLTGYSYFFYEGEKGLLGNLFVLPSPAQLDQACLLLEHALDTLVATPGLRRVEAQLPQFPLESLERPFRAYRFDLFLRRFMLVQLGDAHPSRASAGNEAAGASKQGTLPQGFRMEAWERKHDRAAAELLFHGYRDHVDTQLNSQYGSLPGALHLIENIVVHQGCGEFLPRESRVLIHERSQKLAGLLALTAVRPSTAHIPQIAVAREFQGMGLGRVMLEAALQNLPPRGYREVSLTVTDSNAGAVRLYERLGFETLRTFGGFAWNRS